MERKRKIEMIVSVAVEKTALHFDKLFDYLVPPTLSSQVQVGIRVLVPFGNSNSIRQGFVLAISENEQATEKQKNISEILDQTPILSQQQIDMVRYLKASCFCTWFEAIRTVLPSGLSFRMTEQGQLKRKVCDKTVRMICIANPESKAPSNLSPKQQKVYELLREVGTASVKEVCYFAAVTEVVVKNLLKTGVLVAYEREVYRNPYAEVTSSKTVSEIHLTPAQQRVFEHLYEQCGQEKPGVALLHGVTGSGKTQVFIKLIDYILSIGKQSILLVPEISLTPQMLASFQALFGSLVAVFHSALTMGEQLDEYKRVQRGEAQIIIGTRSAVFAPCEQLGLIVLDEEGESSYKSSELSPRYHARDVARFRCEREGALLLLASATPSIESRYFAQKGIYQYLTLTERYQGGSLPQVQLIDQRYAAPSDIPGITQPLAEELHSNLHRKEQSILLLNRRGYHSTAVCVDCGYVAECPHCSAALTYHQANQSLMCHYCGYASELPERCPVCGQKHLLYHGYGTQRVEEYLKKAFPDARVLRMDADTTFTRERLEGAITAFANGEYDIMIGTQIVAKGLNFPNVTLVGVLSCDSLLYGADFRCHEHLFSLLTQVVGRGGRGELPGRAVIQTYHADHALLQQAALQDYESFYQNEILERKQFFCPPFCDLCIITFRGLQEAKVQSSAKIFLRLLRVEAENCSEEIPMKVLGISTPYLVRLHNQYRRRIIIKCRNRMAFRRMIYRVYRNSMKQKEFAGIRISIDMNGEIV